MAIALTLITLAFGPVVGRNPHSLHDRAHGPSLGTDGSNPALSSGESANFQFLARCDCDGETRFIALAYGKFESSSLQRGVSNEPGPSRSPNPQNNEWYRGFTKLTVAGN